MSLSEFKKSMRILFGNHEDIRMDLIMDYCTLCYNSKNSVDPKEYANSLLYKARVLDNLDEAIASHKDGEIPRKVCITFRNYCTASVCSEARKILKPVASDIRDSHYSD